MNDFETCPTCRALRYIGPQIARYDALAAGYLATQPQPEPADHARFMFAGALADPVQGDE